MKTILTSILLLLAFGQFSKGQTTDQLINKCVTAAGAESKYIKDFVIQLGQSGVQGEFRYKANISLWKDMKYRFTMSSTDNTQGQLILNIKDGANKIVLTSYDSKNGKAYSSVDFICNKSGIYQLGYDFTSNQQGSGVGLVSLVK